MLGSQTSRSRNTPDPPWQYKIDADASPKNLGWDRFSGLESVGKWLDSSAAGLVGVIRNDTGRRVEKRQAFRIDTPRGASLKEDFLRCMRTREKPVVDGQLGLMSQVAVGLAVESFRQNRVMFFDPVKLKAVQKPA